MPTESFPIAQSHPWQVFELGGWSQAEYNDDHEITPDQRAKIEMVLRGEVHENEAQLGLPPRLADAMMHVREIVVHKAKHAMAQRGLRTGMVEQSLSRIGTTAMDHRLVHAVFGELVKQQSVRIGVAMEEALINELKHAHLFDPRLTAQIAVRVAGARNEPVLEVWNRNQNTRPFEPDKVPNPTNNDRLEVPNGRGLLLMRAFMDQVEFGDQGFHGVPGSSTHMTKRLHGFDDDQLDDYVRRALRQLEEEAKKKS